MNILVTAFSLFVEMFISINLFDSIFDIKIKPWRKNLVGIGLYIIYFLTFVFLYNEISNTVVFGLINCLLASFGYHCNLKYSVLSGVFITVLMMGTELLTMAILSIPYGGDFNAFSSSVIAHFLTVIFSKLFLLIAVKFSVHFGLFFKIQSKIRTPIFLFIFPICSMAILYTFWVIASDNDFPWSTQIIIVASSIAIVLSVMLAYIFYSKTSKELDEFHEKERETDRIKADAAYYALLDRQNKILNAFIEEEQNHLQTIKKLANSEDVNEYIERIYDEIQPKNGGGVENEQQIYFVFLCYCFGYRVCSGNAAF